MCEHVKEKNHYGESNPNEESNDSSDDFSANKPSASKKMAQNVMFHVPMAPEEAFEEGHMINPKNIHPQTQN